MTEDKQIAEWRGSFGDAYVDRNRADPDVMQARSAMWRRILAPIADASPQSILEVGANIGLNMRALRELTRAELYAVEPNDRAREVLVNEGIVPANRAINAVANALPLEDNAVDLGFTCGVLIHVPPKNLLPSCREIHRVSRRFVACIEYFSVQPEEIEYRGQKSMLFKRDFGAFWLDNFPDLRLVDYGFFWRRATGLDNLTWWLFKKAG